MLTHLREHLKAHADGNRASPDPDVLEEGLFFNRLSSGCLALVRFLAYRRIKPHGPPLVQVPVYSFEF